MFGDWEQRYDQLCAKLDANTAAMRELTSSFPRSDQQHSRQYREWERWTLLDGGVASGGALTVGGNGSNLVPASSGQEAYLTSVIVSATGASSGGTAALYIGDSQEQNLIDYAAALSGSSPSRLIAYYDLETVWIRPGEALTIVFASLAASSSVFVKATGKRRSL